MSRRKTVAASPSPAPPSPVAPAAAPAPPGGETPSSAGAPSRKSLRHAARTSQVAITTTTETQQQDDATFEDLVATNGEEEEDSSSAPRVSEHVETAHASSSLSKKKSTSLSKLQPKGAWKMYDNLSVVDHDRRNERGRVQRNTNRPNYEDSRQRVFGHESASNEKKKKREEEKDSDKPDEEAAVSPLKKPRGRPPNGKVWDDDACAYVSADAAALPIRNTGAKKTAPPVANKKTTKTELASEVADLKQDVAAMKKEMKDGFAALRDLLASK